MAIPSVDINAEDLPVSVNEQAIRIARHFEDIKLLECLQIAEKKRWWGDATHLNDKGRFAATFTFKNGVCMKCAIYEWVGDRNFFRKSIPFYKQG